MAEVRLSVVIPTFRSQNHLARTLDAVEEAISQYDGGTEIVVVDDGSPDNTWAVLRAWLASPSRRVLAVGVQLRKNVGQHSATLCGLRLASGQFVATIDDDLQNDPSEIIDAIRQLDEGKFDVLIAAYEQQSKARTRKAATKIVDLLNTQLFGKPAELKLSPFRVMHRRAVQRIIDTKVPEPYLTGEILLSSDRIGNFQALHHKRIDGRSTYRIPQLLALFRRIIVNYSTKPLRWVVLACTATSFLSLVISTFVVLTALSRSQQVPGWSSTVCVISLFSGLILLALAVLAEYFSSLIYLLSGRKQYEIEVVEKNFGRSDDQR